MRNAYSKYIAALLLFGSNGVVASHISLNSYEIVLMRTLIGSLFLLLLFGLTKGKMTFWRHKKAFLCLAVSGVAMGASWMFLYEAYQQIGVSIASLAYYCGPVLVMALSPLLFQEKLTAPKLLGFAAVLCGLFLVNGQIVQNGSMTWGLVCGGMSAVTYALMVIFNKKAEPITGLENTVLQLSVSFLTVALFVFMKQGFTISIQRGDIVPVFILGLLNTGIGCYLYFSSISRLPVQTVAICGYLEPLSAVAFSFLLLGEALTPIQLIGGMLIIGGAVFGECVKTRQAGSDAKCAKQSE